MTDDEDERLRAQAAKFSPAELARVIALLLAAQTDMRWTTSPRLSLELALSARRIPETDPQPAGLSSRGSNGWSGSPGSEAGARSGARPSGRTAQPPPSRSAPRRPRPLAAPEPRPRTPGSPTRRRAGSPRPSPSRRPAAADAEPGRARAQMPVLGTRDVGRRRHDAPGDPGAT